VALEVEALAVSLSDAPRLSEVRATAIDFAVHALGIPYEWGGNGPATYDCSGLTVAAFRSAGLSIPRTAQTQHDAALDAPGDPGPGELVFFGSDLGDIGHVGLVVGRGLMIDAPQTGTVVRIETYGWTELLDLRAVPGS
jgi:cell wall-associated NlpC family hydrolase